MAALDIYYQNVRGMRTKTNDIYNNILTSNLKIIAFTETWLNCNVSNNEFIDPRYVVYRRDRVITDTSKKDGGGILIAVSNDIQSIRMQNWESSVEDLWIVVDISINGKKTKVAICIVYLPPTSNKSVRARALSEFLDNVNSVMMQIDNVIIIGDFNLRCIDWQWDCSTMQNIPVKYESTLGGIFIDFILANDLRQLNAVLNSDGVLLDLVLTNVCGVKAAQSLDLLSKLDPLHPCLQISTDFTSVEYIQPGLSNTLNFYRANFEKISRHLKEIDWRQKFSKCASVDDMTSTFYSDLRMSFNEYVPLRSSIKAKPCPPWYTKNLKNLLSEKEKLRKRFARYKNPRDLLEFRLLRNYCHKLNKLCLRQYKWRIEAMIQKQPKDFWRYIKYKRGNTISIPATVNLGDVTASAGPAVSQLFATHFSSVYSDAEADFELLGDIQVSDLNLSSSNLSMVHLSESKVLKGLQSLDISKGAGPDKIPPYFARRCASVLALPLTLIFNRSLHDGKFPEEWKRARIVPVHKKGDIKDVKNYRPISILSCFAKVFERLIRPVVTYFINPHLSDRQHGFRRCRSTITNLVEFITDVSIEVDSGLQVDAVYTDLSSAFDKVNHRLLIAKLEHFGMHGQLLNWFSSYLTNRPQVVNVMGNESLSYCAKSGVPQGSILGPILFTIFVNDIVSKIQYSKCSLYADDLKLYRRIDSTADSDLLQSDLDQVKYWCEANYMILNASKCYHIRLTRKRLPILTHYEINGTLLKQVTEVKDLGVTVDSRLKFDIHIDRISCKAAKMLGFIKRNAKDFRSPQTLKLLFNCLVRSHLEYASVVWNPSYTVQSQRLEGIQRAFTRLPVQQILSITLITTFVADRVISQDTDREHKGPQICGGTLRGPVGVIQTPNFPNPFPVPIKCRWIIEHNIANGTISIYFTQQYTTSGLTFTEYMYYDETYKLGERRALTVTEENITRVKWLQVQSPVLVVELTLNRLEGTQLRALGLLSVFGFNVTYAVKAPTEAPGPASCSVIECRLLGHCYARKDFREFFCSCFDGYSGPDCGEGPLCPRTSNMCKNGGTCRQMGPAAVSCVCAPGYTGDLCESQLAAPECDLEECLEGCAKGTSCDCSPKDSDATFARFETRLQIVDQSNVNISTEVVKQITNYLRIANITIEDDVEILNISTLEETNKSRSVWLRVWAPRKEAGALRAALARLAATRSRTDQLKFLPATLHFNMQPALSLHTLIVNHRPEVWEGSEFILSCMAYGSPDINFTWYKDGVKVNFNGTTRDIWTRTVAEDALGRRMSVLGISEAKRIDSGKWSCSADDGGRRRCRALRVAVLRPPDIRLVPSTLTVAKGDNVSITCLAGAGRVHGALGFSWARERSLLPLAPGKEVWEDLYPAGSVLKLYNVMRSGEYRCQVSSVAGTNAKGVTLWALSGTDIACEAEPSHGLRWPRTAPGAHASAACPPGHSGETSRFCEPKTGLHGVKWMLPDFSNCCSDSLKDIYKQFIRISYGYSWHDVSQVVQQYGAVLRSLPPQPGAGAVPLQHASHMLEYLMSPAGRPRDRADSVDHFMKIYNILLKHPDAFLDEEKIYNLQNAIVNTAIMKDNLDEQFLEFTVKTKSVREDNSAHFKPPSIGSFSSQSPDEWVLASAGVELLGKTENASVVVVQYHNLGLRLPSLRRSIEYNSSSSRSGREMEYVLTSQQVQVHARGVDASAQHTVTLLFTHVKNYSVHASKLVCGVRTTSDPRTWSTRACEVRVPEPSHVACRCRGLGTYALFTVARSILTDAEKDLKGIVKITVGLGGAMCLVAAALQLLALAPGRHAKLPVLLKAATAGTHSAAMLTLLECDTKQEEACPGALGWVCAACWCAGGAALCAQPLLLQAELAGRAQRASSVGLLAGVCTLAWLTARLWGGAPLQLGAAAQAVCAAGGALLAALCLALALCAAARLRSITHKLPAERRNYLKDRRRVVWHTLVLLGSTLCAQSAGVLYAQPGPRSPSRVAALAAAALANGVAMLVCYVARDEDCLRAARRALAQRDHWRDSPAAGDTSLSLYIKQGGEVESRGGVGMLDLSPTSVSPAASYWRAPGLESPGRIHRRVSTPDSRADIVRCVEYKDTAVSPHYERHTVCDLIPCGPQDYTARVCLELAVTEPPSNLTCSVDFEPYSDKHIDRAETCTLCVQPTLTKSNPDISKIPSPPIKSCLKKSNKFSSSSSLTSADTKDDSKTKSDIEQVNREWNKAYDSPDAEKMLNKISSDLDFLLNRNKDSKNVLDEIEEAPT